MADQVMGALSSLIPKLGELLREEYNLQTGVKERISSLTQELEQAQAALRMVAPVPWDQLNEQDQIWARQVREASYDMDDVLDTFLVHVKGLDSAEEAESWLKRLGDRITNLWNNIMSRRQISVDVKNIMTRLQEVTEKCRRYKVIDIVARPATESTVDPRLHAMYTKTKLVGIDESSSELKSKLQLDDMSNTKKKIVSIVGIGGLGKTTLAKAVYDTLYKDYACLAFVSVGRNPNMKEVVQRILIKLDQQRYMDFKFAQFTHISEFIDELRKFLLQNQRYFIVIDDIWETESWKIIRDAIDVDNDRGGRVIITTRNTDVAEIADEVYTLQPLPYGSSRELFFTRIYGQEGKVVDSPPDEISDKFIRKCGGIPLAIITMASLLAGKQRIEWSELYKTIDFGDKENMEAVNTMKILSSSFYDLPSYLRTCLLYLSAYPEDTVIPKDSLIWKWVAEGFVQEKQGKRSFEVGEGYFNVLINRSFIQAVGSNYDNNNIGGCRVHDMVLDFIRSMSHEEFFFTVLDNDQGTQLLQSNVRRLAYHHQRTIMGHSGDADDFNMPKLRSFIALECGIETWVPLSRFKILRVLALENCKPTHGQPAHMEHLGHLLHLRYLSLSGARIHRIPKEIGALRFLQTLDLWESKVKELSSKTRLPEQLVCLRVTFNYPATIDDVASVENLTSLEELSIVIGNRLAKSWLVKQLGRLTELRVLDASIDGDEESKQAVWESVRHLQKLQRLNIVGFGYDYGPIWWSPTKFSLSRHLRHLSVSRLRFCNLPSGVHPSCLPNLSHLNLMLRHVDENDLKMLGGFPELRFLGLELQSSATISNISDNDAGYFPKLRCCRLTDSMVLFLTNKKEKSISFHVWNGEDDIPMPSIISEDELDRSLHHSKHSKSAAPAALFMPSLQALHFQVRGKAMEDKRYCDNLGLEYLSSLREISARFSWCEDDGMKEKFMMAVLKRAAQVHPNRPTLHFT